MRSFLGLLGAASLVNTAAIPQIRAPVLDYEAIIIGGGPAGLSALSGLARVRRKVLLIDSGEYRNAATRHMHDVLGFDGITPAYFRYVARQQISYYGTVTMTNGTVTQITPGDSRNTYFTIKTTNTLGPDADSTSSSSSSTTTKTLTTRKVVLATGLRDMLPSTPGVAENWGKGIYWCPWCDGYEHADQPLGLLGTLDSVPGAVREVVTLNSDVVAFVNGSDTPEYRAIADKMLPGWRKYLEIHNVTIENRTISAITRLQDGTPKHAYPSLPSMTEHDSFEVELEGEDDGQDQVLVTVVKRAAFLASFPSEQRSKVGKQAGVALNGGRLAVDQARGLLTNVPGIYAVGDANSDNVTNVPHALFSGKRTAVYLHIKLAQEDAKKEINGSITIGKRDDISMDLEARSLWPTVNGSPEDDVLYAGVFDGYSC